MEPTRECWDFYIKPGFDKPINIVFETNLIEFGSKALTKIEQLQAELNKMNKIADARICDSCMQEHRVGVMCPPHEVRMHGDMWYHKTIQKLQVENERYKKALEFIKKTSEDCEWRSERDCYETAEQALKGE